MRAQALEAAGPIAPQPQPLSPRSPLSYPAQRRNVAEQFLAANRDEKGEVHHHTKTYMEQHGGKSESAGSRGSRSQGSAQQRSGGEAAGKADNSRRARMAASASSFR
jgi:hypothetical protein